MWEKQYRARRYLEHISENALNRRLEDILANLTTLTAEGKIGYEKTA